MSIATIAAIAYGILALVGGIIGYAKAKSKPSLVSGVISGILLIASGLLASNGLAWGISAAALITAILVIVFIVRLVKTKKFMPAGIMTIAGIAALIIMLS